MAGWKDIGKEVDFRSMSWCVVDVVEAIGGGKEEAFLYATRGLAWKAGVNLRQEVKIQTIARVNRQRDREGREELPVQLRQLQVTGWGWKQDLLLIPREASAVKKRYEGKSSRSSASRDRKSETEKASGVAVGWWREVGWRIWMLMSEGRLKGGRVALQYGDREQLDPQ